MTVKIKGVQAVAFNETFSVGFPNMARIIADDEEEKLFMTEYGPGDAWLEDQKPSEGVPEHDPLIRQLLTLVKNEEAMARLHPIEREILTELIVEPRHLRCEGCKRWVTMFINRLNGEPLD